MTAPPLTHLRCSGKPLAEREDYGGLTASPTASASPLMLATGNIDVRLIDQPPHAAAIGELLGGRLPPCWLPEWPMVLNSGFGHRPYLLAAYEGERLAGYLPLCLVHGPLFGRFLVSLPYLNSAGVLAVDEAVARHLIDRAVRLADELDVRYLELRHERRMEHAGLTREMTGKVHLRLVLPNAADELWDGLKAKVRNQVRKGREPGFEVRWGGAGLLDDFYAVFSRNMRDLGTPVFSRRLFRAIAEALPDRAEFCVVRHGRRPVATALLIHGDGVTEVPSASALRSHNPLNVNMLMYWHLLERAIERGQRVFDFGRSSEGSGTFQFKKQWGAEPHPAVWQYYVRRGDVGDVRPDNARYRVIIRAWQRLPLWLTRLVGPAIVRGIP